MNGQEATAPSTSNEREPDRTARGIRIMRSPSTGGTVEDFSSALFPPGRPGRLPGNTSPVGGLRMSQDFAHDPVMVNEVVALLAPVPAGVLVDGTLGGGGHGAADWPPTPTWTCWASTVTSTR